MKIELKNIRKSFGSTEVLHGISFCAEGGQALGLLGRNGAGKTTTIRILMNVFQADGGEILLDGKPFDPSRHQIGYLPEERGLYPKKKVGEQVMYLAKLRGLSAKEAKTSTEKWLKRLQVDNYIDKKLETLSKGNQQKVQLAQTLVCNPDIVILDEPFSGLDPVNSQVLKDVIQEIIQEGKIVIFSSHQMSYVEEFCEDIVIIHHGEVVLGGKLGEIRREKGKGRLEVSCMDKKPEELAALLKIKWPDKAAVEKITKDKVLVRLMESAVSNDLVQFLLDEGLVLESFGSYEPSLNDIFVESAGDEA